MQKVFIVASTVLSLWLVAPRQPLKAQGMACCGRAADTQYWAKEAVPGLLLLKVKSEYLAVASLNETGIAELDHAIASLPGGKAKRLFPNAAAPREGFPDDVEIRLIFQVAYDPALPVAEALRRIGKCRAWLDYAEPVFRRETFAPYVPNDFDSAASAILLNVAAPEGWGISQGSASVIIAITDDAIFYNHYDLAGNHHLNTADPINGLDDDADGYVDNYYGWDFCGNTPLGPQDNNPAPDSIGQSHGTLVSGFSSTVTDNDTGLVATGFNCSFLPLKLSCGSPSSPGLYNGYQAIVYAAEHGASIINCSWGGGSYSLTEQDAINYATFNHDALVVAAGGNVNLTVPFPAAYDNVLAVGATNINNNLNMTTGGCEIDIVAPGHGPSLSVNNGIIPVGNPGLVYTSVSSPIVAGAAGLLRAFNPQLTAIQAGEQLRVTANAGIYNLSGNSQHRFRYGLGLLNIERALSIQSPAIRCVDYAFGGSQNAILSSGDTVTLVGTFRNYLSPTANLVVTLFSTDTNMVKVLNQVTTLGVIGTNLVRANTTDAFQLIVAQGVPANTMLTMRFLIQDGLYQDYQCFTVVLNPTYFDVNKSASDLLATTVTETGGIGFSSFGSGRGQGVTWAADNYLYEGGTMWGQSASRLADNIRMQGGGTSADMFALQTGTKLSPGAVASDEVHVAYSDANLGANQNHIRVDQDAFGWYNSPDDRFVIMRYIIRNTSFFNIDSLFFGLAFDWDLGIFNNDSANYDPTHRLAYVLGDEDFPNRHVGVALISEGFSENAFATSTGQFVFNDSAKFQALRNGMAQPSVGDVDVFQTYGVGPLAFAPLGRDTVVFALVGGESLAEIQNNVLLARQKYACAFDLNPLAPAIQGPTQACSSAVLNATTPGAIDYLWSNNLTSPMITVTQTGTYSVQVFNGQGCAYSTQRTVNIDQGLLVNVSISDTLVGLAQGGQVNFSNLTPGVLSSEWDFGDGFGFTGHSHTHTYTQLGTYDVTLITTNGVCTDTFYYAINVLPSYVSVREGLMPGLLVYPNPTKDNLFIMWRETNVQGTVKVSVVDQLGNTVSTASDWQPAQQPGLQIEVSDLPPGVYSLMFQQAGRLLGIQRIVILQ